MSPSASIRSVVTAVVGEVLPKFGLAFAVDDRDVTWSVTRSTAGPGLDALRAGQLVQLTLDHRPDFSVVKAYDVLN